MNIVTTPKGMGKTRNTLEEFGITVLKSIVRLRWRTLGSRFRLYTYASHGRYVV